MDDTTPDQRPSPSPGSWRVDLATAALTGVVTTWLPVQRWPRGARWAMHGGMGALTAGATAYLMSRPEAADDPDGEQSTTPPPAFTLTLAALAGLTVVGASRGGQAADTWMERQLVTRGVRRPRAWLGLGASAASLAMRAADRRGATGGAQTSPGSVSGGGLPGVGG